MTKEHLTTAVQATKDETRAALETVLAELNKGQRKKLANNPTVAALLARYGVEIEEA